MTDRTTRTRLSRAAAAGALAVLAAGLLAGCSEDDGAADDVPLGERPSLPTETPELWNPCQGLETARVQELLGGARLTARTGTPTAPQCTFTPADDGAPALDVNYQLFVGTLGELVDTFGDPTEGSTIDVTTPQVAKADDARLVVSTDGGTLAVTGFVQNGDLVQVVNALDPRPFDRATVERAVISVMTDLAEHADESGLHDDAETDETD